MRDTTAAGLRRLLTAGIDGSLGHLRELDVDAAADIEAEHRRDLTRPRVVVVGATKRGKSSLVNTLIGVPGLSPVDEAVATAAYLDFQHGPEHGVRAHVPGLEEPVRLGLGDLRDWGTVLGHLPDGMRPPRRIEIQHSAPLLRHLTLTDTPGTGGLDPAHAEIVMDAVAGATAVLFVVDASAPFSAPELRFLVEAGERVDVVLFALTKIDAYPGWRTILADNKGQLHTHAPRFGSAPWFPVSARLSELVTTLPRDAAPEPMGESEIVALQRVLVDLAEQGHLLQQANILRSVRSEYIRIDQDLSDRMKATDPERVREERSRVAARRRAESRRWSLTLNTETQRARVDTYKRLLSYIARLRDHFGERIDQSTSADLAGLPAEVDAALHALSVRLSHDLELRFRRIGATVLAEVFQPDELQHVLRGINARLRHGLGLRRRPDRGGSDGAKVVVSSAGVAMTAGNAVTSIAGFSIPVAGVGLGLAADAYLDYKRRLMADRAAALTWFREVLSETRSALGDEIIHRFTDLQYALTLALDEAIEQRIKQLDEHLADIERSLAEEKAERARRREALNTERDGLRTRIKQVDEVLVQVCALLPAEPAGS
ncbi:dynamin family protein [Dactylosporangium siamense]|uniref:Dynamin n=1 Tax=Dactylosporangium siamense TaxID=685454 RepID=A0A919PWM0_9ACTN|nr:dynamin family protein [Dactylosporangium siamense]GIG49958.1 dynamin [Dactylosporangium siamense]